MLLKLKMRTDSNGVKALVPVAVTDPVLVEKKDPVTVEKKKPDPTVSRAGGPQHR